MARPASAALNDAGAMTSPSTLYPLTMVEMSRATRLSVVPRMILFVSCWSGALSASSEESLLGKREGSVRDFLIRAVQGAAGGRLLG